MCVDRGSHIERSILRYVYTRCLRTFSLWMMFFSFLLMMVIVMLWMMVCINLCMIVRLIVVSRLSLRRAGLLLLFIWMFGLIRLNVLLGLILILLMDLFDVMLIVVLSWMILRKLCVRGRLRWLSGLGWVLDLFLLFLLL